MDTLDPWKMNATHNVENIPWCVACNMPHSPFQCVVAQALEDEQKIYL